MLNFLINVKLAGVMCSSATICNKIPSGSLVNHTQKLCRVHIKSCNGRQLIKGLHSAACPAVLPHLAHMQVKMYTFPLTTERFQKVIVFPCVKQIKIHITSSNVTQINSEHTV